MALNILVVDDSSVMRSIIIKTLGLCSLPIGKIHQAGNGKQGLTILENNWIDVAMIDINMPEMNGEEMFNRICENPELQYLKVIIVSTESSETRIESLVSRGANFIHKPFTAESLRQTILTSIGGSDEQQTGDSSIAGGKYDF
jgi:two-component system, chemotaxis family, chemotaxis protein CheY